MNNFKNSEELKSFVRSQLAEYLGVEAVDIKDEDFFLEDLHMNPSEIADFIEILNSQSLDTSKIDLSETENVEDLLEALSLHENLI